jgi:hypothetical protein
MAEIQVAQRRGGVTPQHFSVLTEVLHRAVRDDVDDDRLVSHGHPGVDVAGRLVDVAPRAHDLSGLEKLAPAGEVVPVHLPEVAVAGYQCSGLEAQEQDATAVSGKET